MAESITIDTSEFNMSSEALARITTSSLPLSQAPFDISIADEFIEKLAQDKHLFEMGQVENTMKTIASFNLKIGNNYIMQMIYRNYEKQITTLIEYGLDIAQAFDVGTQNTVLHAALSLDHLRVYSTIFKSSPLDHSRLRPMIITKNNVGESVLDLLAGKINLTMQRQVAWRLETIKTLFRETARLCVTNHLQSIKEAIQKIQSSSIRAEFDREFFPVTRSVKPAIGNDVKKKNQPPSKTATKKKNRRKEERLAAKNDNPFCSAVETQNDQTIKGMTVAQITASLNATTLTEVAQEDLDDFIDPNARKKQSKDKIIPASSIPIPQANKPPQEMKKSAPAIAATTVTYEQPSPVIQQQNTHHEIETPPNISSSQDTTGDIISETTEHSGPKAISEEWRKLIAVAEEQQIDPATLLQLITEKNEAKQATHLSQTNKQLKKSKGKRQHLPGHFQPTYPLEQQQQYYPSPMAMPGYHPGFYSTQYATNMQAPIITAEMVLQMQQMESQGYYMGLENYVQSPDDPNLYYLCCNLAAGHQPNGGNSTW